MRDLLLEVHDGVATITINRPQARNALTLQTMAELDEAISSLGGGARVAVIRGAGDRAFCAGGDLKELEGMRSAEEAAGMARRMRATLDRLPQLAIPVIAGINGDALGGGAELAIACDFRVAASHARFGFPQISLGLMLAWGATERLAALVGRGRSLHALLTGRIYTAPEAFSAGILEEVVPADRFDERLRSLAGTIAAAPPDAVAGIKRSVNAIHPHHNPELAEDTVEAFAQTWADPAHWDRAAEMEKRRQERR
ncbi:MAG TPA: enoyl-CoA hydratase/isomerase family protein [Candidatus Dormibacteraeota bacterium]|nr:enoyl-CoA hydratase/isomerase family protein [Candidatus Dormibacteraeota bacterium]